MEVACTAYTSSVDELYGPETGWVTIRKGDTVYIPNMCKHKKPTIAFHTESNIVGFVNMENVVESMAYIEKKTTIFAHGIAVTDFDDQQLGNWLKYSIGHLVLLSPGPWVWGVEGCREAVATGGSLVRVFNLTTVEFGLVPSHKFHWLPNAEVTLRQIIIYEQGKLNFGPKYSNFGDKMVVSWAPKVLSKDDLDLVHHGVQVRSGTVGWWKYLRKLDRSEIESSQAAFEEEAQRRMPPGNTVKELIEKLASSIWNQRVVLTPCVRMSAQEACMDPKTSPSFPSVQGTITSPTSKPTMPPVQGAPTAPSGRQGAPSVNTTPSAAPYVQGGFTAPTAGCNLPQLQPVYPNVYNTQPTPRTYAPPLLLPIPRPEQLGEGAFGPHVLAPDWTWRPELPPEGGSWGDKAKASFMNGEEIVRFPWRKVHEMEMNLEVGDKLIYVARADFRNRWGLKCWWAVPASGGQYGIVPSRVCGAANKYDTTREAQIYDMAIIRGGPCLQHSIHNRYQRCCISFIGPWPESKTCVLKKSVYLHQAHTCCSDVGGLGALGGKDDKEDGDSDGCADIKGKGKVPRGSDGCRFGCIGAERSTSKK